jgi:hypothetical protein
MNKQDAKHAAYGCPGALWQRSCPACVAEATKAGLTIKFDGVAIETAAFEREVAARRAARATSEVRRPSRAQIHRQSLERTARLPPEVVKALDPYSYQTWSGEISGGLAVGSSTVARPVQQQRQVDPSTGAVRPLDPRVVAAVEARRQLATLDAQQKGKALEAGRVDVRGQPKAVAVKRAVQLGVSPHVAQQVFRETPAEVVAKDKLAERDRRVHQRISEKYPLNDRPGAWQRVLAERVRVKIEAAARENRRPHARDFDDQEWPTFRDLVRARIAARERGTPPGTPTPSGTQGPTPIPRKGEKPAGY